MPSDRTSASRLVVDVIDHEHAVVLRVTERTWTSGDGHRLALLHKAPARTSLADRPRPPVILVHGLRGTRGNWNTACRSFQAYLVDAGYETFCPELRGSGESRRLGSPPPRGVLELLELDLLPLLEETAGASAGGQALLVGHSLGGILSCLAAAARPDLVAAVVTLGSPLTVGVDQPLMRLGARLWVGFASAEPLRNVAESRGMSRTLMAGRRLMGRLSLPGRVDSFYPGGMEPQVQTEFEERSHQEPAFPGLLRDLSRLALGRSPEGLDLPGELARVQKPVQCVAGDRDQLAPPAAAEALFAALGSEQKEWLLAGSNDVHFGHTDLILGQHAPRLVWARVLEWLERGWDEDGNVRSGQ